MLNLKTNPTTTHCSCSSIFLSKLSIFYPNIIIFTFKLIFMSKSSVSILSVKDVWPQIFKSTNPQKLYSKDTGVTK